MATDGKWQELAQDESRGIFQSLGLLAPALMEGLWPSERIEGKKSQAGQWLQGEMCLLGEWGGVMGEQVG